jgi:DNA-binding NarL/FixJ family response regulator
LEPEFQVMGSVDDGRRLLRQATQTPPSAILVDITMPLLNGIEAIRQLKDTGCKSKLLILTMHADPEFVSEALDAGADAYLLKHCDPEEVLTALRQVMVGRRYVAEQLSKTMLEASEGRLKEPIKGTKLSIREREVLQMIAEGLTVKEMAAVLNLSPRTVQFHRYNISDKLGLKTLAELARYAVSRGLVAR